MAVLKQKKLYEKQKEDLQAQNYNIESVQMTTDNLRNTMATVDAMQSANKEMKKQYGKLDINKIEVGVCRYTLDNWLIRNSQFTMIWRT